MTELLHAAASWKSLLLVIFVFGFAPGFCLRLIVLIYPRSDPRRTELVAELYAVPRIQRPLWVAEQLETALFEGVPHRLAAIFRWFDRTYRARATGLALDTGRGVLDVGREALGVLVALLPGAVLVSGLGAVLGAVLVSGLGTGLGTGLVVGIVIALFMPFRVVGIVLALVAGLGAGVMVGLQAGFASVIGTVIGSGLGAALGTGLWTGLCFIGI